MDPIALLRKDHRTVEKLFKQFEKAGDNAGRTKRRIVDQVIRELSIHAAIEEQVLYPFARLRLESLEDDVLEAIEEHHVAKLLLVELEKIGPDAERFDAKMTVLIENIRHHVEEEEGSLFPRLQKIMARNEAEALSAQLQLARKSAPTRPHPAAPDSPPGNLIAGPLAALLDAGKDAIASLAQKGRRLRPA